MYELTWTGVAAGYPKRVDEVFQGHTYGVDAALYQKNKIYLFKVSVTAINILNTSSIIIPIEPL